MENPYVKIVNIIKEKGAALNPPSIMIGEVTSEDPFTVKIGELEISKENLFVADNLMKEYKREGKQNIKSHSMYKDVFKEIPGWYKITSTCTAGGSLPMINSLAGPGEKEFTSESEIILTDGLIVGDVVAVMPTYDMQNYLVLARLIRP